VVKRGKEAYLSLLSDLPQRHVIVTVGKGGVGKTTVSILLSLALSEKGKTLLASLDPAKHLLEYLGIPRTLKEVEVKESLKVIQYDIDPLAKKVSSEYAALLKQVVPGLRILGLEDLVNAIRHAPGFEEEIFLRILERLYSKKDVDYVVIDTPPTGITHRIFNLPRLYLFWLERLYDLRLKIVSLRYSIARSMGEKVEESDPVLEKLETMREHYKKLLDDIRNPRRTSVFIVTTPEPLPVYEAEESVKFFSQLGVNVKAIVINKVLPEDVAEKLGTKASQEENLKRALSIKCNDCKKLLIRHHSKTPRSLKEAEELIELTELVETT
jgi:arsenite-transporting ATPase